MALVITDDKYYKNIANKIREKIVSQSGIKPENMEEQIEEACANEWNKGWTEGHAEGYGEGFDIGVGDVWDSIQDGGKRTVYDYGFRSWGAEIIEPKHQIQTAALIATFYDCQKLKRLPNIIPGGDGFTNLQQACIRCYELEEVPFDIKMSSAASNINLQQCFYQCRKLKVVKFILSGNESNWKYTFEECNALENLNIEGIITASGIDLHWSTKLTKASIISIINALSSSATGTSITISKTAVNTAFQTTDGASDGSTSEEWLGLVATKSNWTISLK